MLGPIVLICLHADPTQPSGIFEGGGTHAYLRELSTGLAKRGHFCHLVTRRQSPELSAEVKVSPLTTLHRIDIGPPGKLDKRLLNDFHNTTVEALEALITSFQEPPRLLHSVYWNSGRAAMSLSSKHGMPFVHTVISNGLGRRLRGATGNADSREKIERDIFNAAACIFSISKDEKQDLLNLYNVDSRKVVVIGRPVDVAYMSPAHDELGQPRKHWSGDQTFGDSPP